MNTDRKLLTPFMSFLLKCVHLVVQLEYHDDVIPGYEENLTISDTWVFKEKSFPKATLNSNSKTVHDHSESRKVMQNGKFEV